MWIKHQGSVAASSTGDSQKNAGKKHTDNMNGVGVLCARDADEEVVGLDVAVY
jgi:hypothetical protein